MLRDAAHVVVSRNIFAASPSMCDRNGGRRLRQWLIEQIDSNMYPGLVWESDEKSMFRIPWKHAGKQDYNQEVDASIFKVQTPTRAWTRAWAPAVLVGVRAVHRGRLPLDAQSRQLHVASSAEPPSAVPSGTGREGSLRAADTPHTWRRVRSGPPDAVLLGHGCLCGMLCSSSPCQGLERDSDPSQLMYRCQHASQEPAVLCPGTAGDTMLQFRQGLGNPVSPH